MRESLENVKVGDVVICHTRLHETEMKVTKVTKTNIVIGSQRYRKKDGNLVGSDAWTINFITIPKDSEIERVRQNNFRAEVVQKLRNISIISVSYEQAVKIKEVLGL